MLADCLELGQLSSPPGAWSAPLRPPCWSFPGHTDPCSCSRKPLCPPPRASTAPPRSGRLCTPRWPSCCLSCSPECLLIAHVTPHCHFLFLCPSFPLDVNFHWVCWLTDRQLPGSWAGGPRTGCAGQTFLSICPQPRWVQGLRQGEAWDFWVLTGANCCMQEDSA